MGLTRSLVLGYSV